MRNLGLFLMFLFISSLSWSAPLTAGYVTKAKTGKVIIDSAIYENGGNVGIGTTSPQGTLDVDGSVYLSTLSVINAATVSGGLSVYGVSGLGIGTTNPAAYLQVGAGTPNRVNGENDVFVKDSIEVDGNIYVDGSIYGYGTGYSSAKALCWYSNRIGYCSSTVDASGNCTCN